MSKNKMILVVIEDTFKSESIISSVLQKFASDEDIVMCTDESEIVAKVAKEFNWVYSTYNKYNGTPNEDMIDFVIVFASNESKLITQSLKRCKEIGIICVIIAK